MEATDYQAAALAQLTGEASTEAPAVETAPPEPGEATPTDPPAEGEQTQTEPPAEGEQTVAEEKPEEAPAEPPPSATEQKLAARFEALSRKDRESRERESHFQRQVQDAESRIKAAQDKLAPFEKAQQLIAAGKHGAAMRMMGLDYQRATQDLVEGKDRDESLPQEDPIRKELAEIKKQLAEERAEKAAIRTKATTDAFRAKMQGLADTRADDFAFVLAEDDGVAMAYSEIEAHVRAGGTFPEEATEEEIAEAALGIVEKKLREKEEKRQARLQARKGLATIPGVAPKEAARPASQFGPKSTKTLTNSQAVAAPRTAPAEPKTPEEFQAAALKVLMGSGG